VDHRIGLSIAFEASGSYGHLHDQLAKIAQRVVVAHAGQLRLIFRAKRKNDRFDAAKIARLLHLDMIPEVWVPPTQLRAWRRLIEHRQSIVRERTRAKNALRALLRTHGLTPPKNLWTVAGRQWIAQAEFESIADALQRDQWLVRLDLNHQMIGRVEKELDAIAARQPAVKLLRTIPGVGPRTAEALAAYIGDVRRFGNLKQLGAYLGLVPCQDASAAANRLGHITRDGPATVRHLLTEAAWQTIRHDPASRAFFERVAGGKPDRRKIALVATAHRLARVAGAMLHSGEVWRAA
jgi:transposase